MTRLREFEVELDDPIGVHINGQKQEVDRVLLIAPSARHFQIAGRIKKICSRAFKPEEGAVTDEARERAAARAKDSSTSGEDEKITWDQIINMIAMSEASEEIFTDLYGCFRKLLIAGCGTIGGVGFTNDLFNDLSFSDLERMFGKYVPGFLLDSLTKNRDSDK